MSEMKFTKAVAAFGKKELVYACQFTEDKFDFQEMPGKLGRVRFLDVNGQHFLVRPNEWMVYFHDRMYYTFLSDDDFRNKYCLYDELPQSIKEFADSKPSFTEWAAWLDLTVQTGNQEVTQ